MSQTITKPKSRAKKSWATLPLSRVNTIMRSSPEVSSISPDAIALAAHSAELFIAQLAKDSFAQNGSKSRLEYNDLSTVVNTNPRMAFLQDILPKKIKVKDYEILLKKFDENNKSESNDEDMDEGSNDN